jgi:hypothetical protein
MRSSGLVDQELFEFAAEIVSAAFGQIEEPWSSE